LARLGLVGLVHPRSPEIVCSTHLLQEFVMTHEVPAQDVNPTPAKRESATPAGAERTRDRRVYVPLVDIVERDQVLHLVADLPGVDEQGVEILIEKNVLTLRGRVGEEAPAGFQLRYEEYGVGDYERTFTLPNEIDREAIKATLKDGVLRVTLPKLQPQATRRVLVTAG
jgi:HSP20 family molecular chaperone IbpA